MTTDAVVRLAQPDALDAWEPLRECLIACEIFERIERSSRGGLPAQIWVPRTYRCYRAGSTWRIDFGEGHPEARSDWAAVVHWFCMMRPRKIEVLID